MAKTVVKDNENIEDTLRRFKRDVSRAGTLSEAKKRKYYAKPGVLKREKLKENAAKKKKFNR